MSEKYGYTISEVLDLPENVVLMYLRQAYIERVDGVMNDIIRASGEDGIKKLPGEHPARVRYLNLRLKQREMEMIEHRKIKEAFARVNNG